MAKADKGAKEAEVLAKSEAEVKLDARDDMSYADYAAQRPEPVITVQRIIDHRATPPEPAKTQQPNMVIKQEVLFGQPPPEPPPKPDRAAATVKTYVMHRQPAPKPPRRGIASMEPGR